MNYGTAAGAVMDIGGGIVSMIGALDKGQMPLYQPTTLAQGQSVADQSNLSELPTAQKIAGGMNQFNQEQVLQALSSAIPEYSALRSGVTGAVGAELSGEFAPGEQGALQDLAASEGLASGTSGSDFSKFSALGLGFNALEQRYNAGINSASQWLSTANALTKAPLMDVSGMFTTPMQAAQFTAQQNELAYESQLGRWSMPNSLQIIGSGISEIGGQLSGMGGMTGGGGGMNAQTASNAGQMAFGAASYL